MDFWGVIVVNVGYTVMVKTAIDVFIVPSVRWCSASHNHFQCQFIYFLRTVCNTPFCRDCTQFEQGPGLHWWSTCQLLWATKQHLFKKKTHTLKVYFL